MSTGTIASLVGVVLAVLVVNFGSGLAIAALIGLAAYLAVYGLAALDKKEDDRHA